MIQCNSPVERISFRNYSSRRRRKGPRTTRLFKVKADEGGEGGMEVTEVAVEMYRSCCSGIPK